MSGHSKWSTIKRKKEATDQKRSRVWAKLLRAIEVAARESGPSIESNMTLASAVDKARDFSVPNENIERAIKRGIGALGGAKYEELTYEGYGPGGVALLIETLTDNRNRTGQEVRYALQRSGGNPAEPGSTTWMFSRKGVILVEKTPSLGEDDMLRVVLDAGGEDFVDSQSYWEVTTEPSSFRDVSAALESSGATIASAELTMVPKSTVTLTDAAARSCLTLVEALEDLDDVQAVYANFDIPDELLEEVG